MRMPPQNPFLEDEEEQDADDEREADTVRMSGACHVQRLR